MRGLFFDAVSEGRCSKLGLDFGRARAMHADLEARREFHGYRLWAVLMPCLWDEAM